MSALAAASGNSFIASLALADGASAHISAPSLTALAAIVAKLQGNAANDTPNKPAGTAAPAPQVQAGNAPASTGTPASAPAAASGSGATGAGEGAIVYDQVRDKVLEMSKKLGRDSALKVLGQFNAVSGAPADHGNKLQLPDYPAFIKAANDALAGAAK